MKIQFLFLLLLCSFQIEINIGKDYACQCDQIMLKTDCQAIGCLWQNNKCQTLLKTIQNQQAQSTNSYCTYQTESTCRNTLGCAYLIDSCIEFTSCSYFQLSTDQLCQQVSDQCISDGTKCIELNECENYLTETSCKKNLYDKYCYWDGGCSTISDCEKLPQYLITDQACREALSYCTTSSQGGCQTSALSCEGQPSELQCYWDYSKTISCDWNGQQCYQRSCASAPLSIKRTSECQSYKNGCIANYGGGCIQLSTCENILVYDACVIDYQSKSCYWYNEKCVTRICSNAPAFFNTFKECQQFLDTCVPNLSGCKVYSTCTDFIDSITCNSGLLTCYWNDENRLCTDKSCSNAPANYDTFEKCTAFNSNCSIVSNRCATKTCENAPLTLTSNYFCEQYKNGCITKSGGGCRTNTDCQSITYENACFYDSNGNECFWQSGYCKIKTCQNAPSSYTTFQECQDFSQYCTNSKSGSGCVDLTCQSIYQEENCLIDSSNNVCQWVGFCFDKTCQNAPLTLTTSNDCSNYLTGCIVRDTGAGCMNVPYQCEEMTLQDQCIVNAYNEPCKWINSNCYLDDCNIASSSYTTYEQCQTYMSVCTTTGAGCQRLMDCQFYENAASCRYNKNGEECAFVSGSCQKRTCQTADSTYTSNSLCDTYLTGCIVNSTNNGCIEIPQKCSDMTTSTQCTISSTNSQGNPCSWNGNCIDRICAAAATTTDYDTFQKCQNFLNTCTVVATGTGGCMTMQNSCTSYTTQRQCVQLLNGGKCSWVIGQCVDQECIYAADTTDYDTASECNQYDSRCTVVNRIGGLGCTIRKNSCNLLSQQQCIQDSNNVLCTWNTNVSPAYCQNRTCELTIGITSSVSNCASWMPNCLINNTSNGCLSRQSSCSSYLSSDNCIATSNNVQCVWSGTCLTRSCSLTQSITTFDHTNCNTWLNTCTVNKPTQCADKLTNCSDVANYDQCYKSASDIQCAWVGTSCVDRTCTNHGSAVTIFTDYNCSQWMNGCSATPDATECEITRTCSNYDSTSVPTTTHTNCVNWLFQCTADSGETTCINKTCTNYLSNITNFTDSTCSAWLSSCTSNDDNTACVFKYPCSNAVLSIYNNDTCQAYWDECIVDSSTGAACVQKTCYNGGVSVFTDSNCNAWYYKCTVSRDGLSCQQKTCSNAQLTNYTKSNCESWLVNCTVNTYGTRCINKRSCSNANITTFTVSTCQAWSSDCTYQNSSSCYDKSCTNYSTTSYSHISCEAWLNRCTYQTGSTCLDKSCYNYQSIITTFNIQNCSNWLLMCTANLNGTGCEPKTCSNHSLSIFNTANCSGWLNYCDVNSDNSGCYNTRSCSPTLTTYSHYFCESYNYACTNNGTSSCQAKKCSDLKLITYNHQFCNSYLSDCTVSATFAACEIKTCLNYNNQITTINHTNCQTWLSNCTSPDNSTCQIKTCSNYGSNISVFNNTNCEAWLDGCVANDAGTSCISVRSCTNTALSSYTHQNCENWLPTCTNNGTTACQVKTCALATGRLSKFDQISCEFWSSGCTTNYSQSACIDKTCYNYGDRVVQFTDTNCSSWLSYCIANSSNSGCIPNKTCSNAIVSSYNDTNCKTWLSSCTANSTFNGCQTKTCYNYGTNITTFNDSNCNAWLSTCTNLSTTGCQDRTCTNTNLSVFSAANCYNWLIYCTANDTLTACVSTKTCLNHNLTVFNHTNCNNWLSTCTVNSGNTACESISCSNASPTLSYYGTYSDSTCNSWLSSCTVNSTNDGCTPRTCSNYSSTSSSQCSSWNSLCTSDGSNCINKTCTNHSAFTLSQTNCNNWLSTCSYYSSQSDCETTRTCSNYSGTINYTNCSNWLSTCTINSSNTGCTTKICANYLTDIGTPTNQTQCQNYLSSCTYSSSSCVEKTCTNFSGTINQTNCEAWSSRCTINNTSTACTYKISTDAITSLKFTNNNCQTWSEAWTLNSSNTNCTSNCADNGLHFSSYTHSNCNSWDPSCTVNSTLNGCTLKTCSNFTGTVSYTNCTNWLSNCTNNNGNTQCIDRTCFNQLQNISATFTNTKCQSFKSTCNMATSYSCQTMNCGDTTATSDSACQTNLSYCQAGQLMCYTQRTCQNYGTNVQVFTHKNCEDWLSTCTVNDTNDGCTDKTCSNNSISAQLINGYNAPSIDANQCYGWNKICINTSSNNGCQERKCSDTAAYSSSCSTYLSTCKQQSSYCVQKSCNNITSPSLSSCISLLPYCTLSISSRSCHSYRFCSATPLTTFTQTNCEQWSTLCTVDTSTNSQCIDKTCYNAVLTSYNSTTCAQWMPTCKVNSQGNGCENRTCSNYGTSVTTFTSTNCSNWLFQCTVNSQSNACIPNNRTCENSYNGYVISYTDQYCQDWLSTCISNGLNSGCISKTCTNYGSRVSTFNHLNCYNWYDVCTNDSTTGCQNKSCTNHGSNITTLSQSNCISWLSTCSFNTGESTCTNKTCTNYDTLTINATQCALWNNSCTYVTNRYGCEYKTCSNYSSTITDSGCKGWLSYCIANQDNTKCVSTRTCSNAIVNSYTHTNCENWLPACTNNSTTACQQKTCDNYSSNITTFTQTTCSGWLPDCTNNSTTSCEQKHCRNYPTSNFTISSSNCQSWYYPYCMLSPAGSNCQYKTCSNHSLTVINHLNCSNWLYYCTVSDDGTQCTTSRTCDSTPITVFNHANCQQWLSTCTVKSGGGGCEPISCTNHGTFVTNFTHNNCQDWSFNCTNNSSNNACEQKNCSNVKNISAGSYSFSACQSWLSSCTNNGTTSCTDKTCSNPINITNWTHQNCESWLDKCQLDKPTTCTTLQMNCTDSGVSYNQCMEDQNGLLCTWYNGSCKIRTCANYSGTTFTHSDCQTWLKTCTVDSGATPTMCVNKPTFCPSASENQCVTNINQGVCVWVTSACQDISCSNYNGASFTHNDCQTWLQICTVDDLSTHAGCQIKKQDCTLYLNQDQCVFDYNGNLCIWTGTICRKRNCDDASQDTNYDDDTKCTSFMPTCTVARIGECTSKQLNCSSYVQQSTCSQNSSLQDCYWNTTLLQCLDYVCSSALTTINSHTDCQTFLNTCTAAQGGGCINLDLCGNYQYEISCVISDSNQTCAWANGKCQLKSCSTAANDSSRDTYQECQNYLSSCTVAATGLGGCVSLTECYLYTSERQCQYSSAGDECQWIDSACKIKSCLTAPSTSATHSDCNSFLSTCTTVAVGNGCETLSESCSSYQSQKQCQITINNVQCYWTGDQCEVISCQNAPSTALTGQLCESHYSLCYSDQIYCRQQICTDLLYQTDKVCKTYLNGICTSDGKTCINRAYCEDALVLEACNTDINNKECEWQNNQCLYKSCSTASSQFITEKECQTYYPQGNCTTKINGGCRNKTSCSEAQIQSACTSSVDNISCVWNNNYCRDQTCDDILGTSQQECESQGCIYDGIKCSTEKTCSYFYSESTCNVGTDGPCKWYSGNCYLFIGCKSIVSPYHSVCQSFSSSCTTNGIKCVGLDNCSNYLIKDSCKVGLDGECVWWDSFEECKRFLSCYELPYLNHQQCYTVSNQCTTNTITGCIPLKLCSQYTSKEQCKINVDGQQSNTVGIIQTGLCSWESTIGYCEDQKCEDLIGDTHQICYSQMITCTSNSQKCVTMSACEEYTDQITCLNALGINGRCNYINHSCTTLECSDIQAYTHENCQQGLQNCISDGTQCIEQEVCANYSNKYSCNYGGVDGNCAWDGSSCNLMTQCSDADIDRTACLNYNSQCLWIDNLAYNGTSSCNPLTCQNLTKDTCQSIKSFDNTTLTLCLWNDGTCQEIQASQLQSSNCRASTLNSFSWNSTTLQCTQCVDISATISIDGIILIINLIALNL